MQRGLVTPTSIYYAVVKGTGSLKRAGNLAIRNSDGAFVVSIAAVNLTYFAPIITVPVVHCVVSAFGWLKQTCSFGEKSSD